MPADPSKPNSLDGWMPHAFLALLVFGLIGAVQALAVTSSSLNSLLDCGADKARYEDHDNNPSTPSIWRLACTGSCASPNVCKERDGSDSTGSFSFCGCGTSSKHWPGRCCTTVLRPNSAGNPVPHTWGVCQECPGGGVVCVIIEHPAESDTALAVCL